MNIVAIDAGAEDISKWRDLYRQEMNCQIVHDSIPSRPGWTEQYLLLADGTMVGYGYVAVAGPWKEKPTVLEFYVLPHLRSRVFDFLEAMLTTSRAVAIEVQTNDPV